MPSFRIEITGQAPIVYHVYKTLTSMGSSPNCDLVLPDPLLPESFAHIHFDGQIYSVSTVSRKNDMTINGKKRKKHKLCHQDKITIGAIEMRFDLLNERPPSKSAPTPTVTEVDSYQKIHDFSARLMQKHDLGELLEELMDAVIDITSADKGFLILTKGDGLTIKVARNLKRENIADAVSQLSDSIIAKVVKTQQPLMISDAMNDEAFSSSKSVMQLKLTSVICVPLLERGKLLGLIYVGNDSIASLFASDTMRALTVFSAQASLIVSNALLLNTLKLDNQKLNERLESIRFGEIIGTSRAMTAVFKKIEKIASTDISVLITGETGTGKELIAIELHRRSPRSQKPFVVINSGAIPENLLESELFGHVKGAFTGAVSNKMGKFQAANGGTLFLDEIGEMPIGLQVKLLRAIQEREVIRVGDTRPEKIDIRILTATNRDLEQEVKEGRFREDLYYRLNVVNLKLPPLRDRDEDCLVIARYLLSRYAKEYNSPIQGFSPNAAVAIRKHAWPGNIREMENRLRKAVVLADSNFLGPEDLDLTADNLPTILSLNEAKENFQRDYINQILAFNNGNRTKTAHDLGVDPRTVFRHLEKEEKYEE